MSVNGDDGSFGACSNGQICDVSWALEEVMPRRGLAVFPWIVALSAGTGFEGQVDKHRVTFYGSGWLTRFFFISRHWAPSWHGMANIWDDHVPFESIRRHVVGIAPERRNEEREWNEGTGRESASAAGLTAYSATRVARATCLARTAHGSRGKVRTKESVGE